MATNALGREQDAPRLDPKITHVRGELYRASDGRQSTVFLVTPAGIVLIDPLHRSFAEWLREELGRQFPDEAVRYLVLTHHHYDRSEGTSVLGKPVELIAHANFNREAENARGTLSRELAVLDRNVNGRLERDELQTDPRFAELTQSDHDQDGTVTSGELYRSVPFVSAAFEARRTITIGERSVELIHVPGHTLDMLAVYFPAERLLFAVDHPLVDGTPLTLDPFTPGEVREWLRAVEPLDFDVMLSGTARDIPKPLISATAQYLDMLAEEVLAAHGSRRSLRDVEASPSFAAYASDPRYVQRESHVAAMYTAVRTFDAQLYVTQSVHSSEIFCGVNEYCRQTTPANLIGMLATTKHLGAAIEWRWGGVTTTAPDAGLSRYAATVRERQLEAFLGSSRVDLQACKLEYSIVSPK